LGVRFNARRANARVKRQRASPAASGTPGGEPLQNTAAPQPPTPALTGRIGAVTFAVSSNCVAPSTGRLFLRINNSPGFYSGEPGTERVSITKTPTRNATAPMKVPRPVESAFVPLPDVVGLKFPVAARSLREYGLVPRRGKRSSSRPAGEVVDQSPAPGADTRTIKIVVLGVSDGSLPLTGTVPVKTAKPPVKTPEPVQSTFGLHTPTPRKTQTAPPIGRVTPRPIATARPRPTASARPQPTEVATPRPTEVATARPTATARPRPTATARPRPTATARPRPSAVATPRPTAAATPRPTAAATPRPTAAATPRPTATARPRPTAATAQPTATATQTSSAAAAALGTASPKSTLAPRSSPTPVNVTLGSPRSGWIWWLIPGGLFAVALGFLINNRMRLARKTMRLLTIEPAPQLDGPTNFDGEVKMAGPTTHLRASVEPGEASFEENGSIVIREEHDG
jgi:hypothetical protein